MTEWETGLRIGEGTDELTIAQVQEAMDAGRMTSHDLVLAYLARIARLDRGPAGTNSVLEINPDALQIAAAMDAERANHGVRGPLHGVPILLKDNIDTGDKLHTSAGSLALAESFAARDAHVAARLRAAGAVILGKANMTEWANFMTEGMPAGYSSRGGQVLNPYLPGKYTVGGSSSGSGAAVAMNLVAAAIGTETSGSILSPANANSVVGIKPTVGLVSRTGIIPIMHTQDTAGPLARTVTDAATLLSAISGSDPQDPATWACATKLHPDYRVFLDRTALRGARLGVSRDVMAKCDPQQLAVMEQALAVLREQGAVVVDPVDLPVARDDHDRTAMTFEFKPNLNAYLARLAPHVPVHSLRELIDYNFRHPGAMLRYGQTLLVAAETASGTLTEPEYTRALAHGLWRATVCGIDAAIAAERLTALVFPGNYGAGISARPGYPSVCVPAGYTQDGRPIGITFTSVAWSEPELIALAYAYEQATCHRRPPQAAANIVTG